MLNYSDDLKELFLKSSVSKKSFEIYVPDLDLTVTEDNLVSETMQLIESLCSDADLRVGACEAAEFRITTVDLDEDLKGKEIEVYMVIGKPEDFDLLYPSDTTFPSSSLCPIKSNLYRVNIGQFKVDSFDRKSNRRFRDLVAYDHMTRFDINIGPWYNALTFPLTLKEFRAKLFEYVCIEENADVDYLLNDHFEIAKSADIEELSGRDLINMVEEMNGVYGHIDRNGIFQHVYLCPRDGLYPSEILFPRTDLYPGKYEKAINVDLSELDQSNYYSLEWEDFQVQTIDQIVITDPDGYAIGKCGEGENGYTIEGNILLQSLLSSELEEAAFNIYGMVTGRTYTPIKNYKGKGCPWIEVGDSLEITTNEGVIDTYVLTRTLSGMQALKDEYEADGNEVREYDSSIARQLTTFIGKARATFRVLDETITLEVTRATEAEGTLNSKIMQNADSITSIVEKSFGNGKDSLQSQIKQEADRITTTVTDGKTSSSFSQTLGEFKFKSNLFSWESTNSSMTADGTLTCKNANITGKITATTGKIGGFTISGNKLVSAGSATIQFGDKYYFEDTEASIVDIVFDENGIHMPALGSNHEIMWKSETGDLYCNELYIDQDWWEGWSVTKTVKQLWEYVYYGGWDKCPSDDDGCESDDCDGGCDCGEDCGEDRLECDIDTSGSCDSCNDSCDSCNYNCDNLEGPGCV